MPQSPYLSTDPNEGVDYLSTDPNDGDWSPEGYTVNEEAVNRQRVLQERRRVMKGIDELGPPSGGLPFMPAGRIAAAVAPRVISGLRNMAGRVWGNAAKSGSDDVAQHVLSRRAGRLTSRNAQRLSDEATPSRILDASGRPATGGSELARRASDAHTAAVAGSKPSRIMQAAEVATAMAAPFTGGGSLAFNAARTLMSPRVRAASAQGLYNVAPHTPEMARAAALAAILRGEGIE